MAVAERYDDKIIIATEFREKELVKQVPGARWDSDAQVWWVPLSWAACVQLRGVFGDSLHLGEALNAWAKEDRAVRRDPCLALRGAEDAPDLAFLTALHPFQRAGVRFLATAKHALLADEMGLGKTVQAIAAMEVLGDDAYPALVVCPNSMKISWAAEINRWAPGRTPVVIAGSAAARKKAIAQLVTGEADIGIINYEALRSHTRLEGYGGVKLTDEEKKPKELNEISFRTVVADEAHRAKDPRAKQTRALWWVSRTASYRFALTGTPVANSPEDVWTLMRFVSPAEFPAKTKFIERYAQQDWSVYGFMQVTGVKGETREELFRILDPRFIRRTKAVVLPQLPAKTYSTRFCEMVPKQKKAYEEMRKEQYAELDSGVLLATNPLVKLTRLLQFASAMGEHGDPAFDVRAAGQVLAGPFATREEAEAIRQATGNTEAYVHDATPLLLKEPSCKVDALEEIVAELGDQQAVVFAESKQLIELAAARLIKGGVRVVQVTGSVPAHERAANVQAFQEGKAKVILLTLGAGGEGLTLTAASTAIFLQRSFNYVRNLQAEDRVHRIGQEDSVTIIDIVTVDTAEERVHTSGVYKAEMADQITRDQETLKAWLKK